MQISSAADALVVERLVVVNTIACVPQAVALTIKISASNVWAVNFYSTMIEATLETALELSVGVMPQQHVM